MGVYKINELILLKNKWVKGKKNLLHETGYSLGISGPGQFIAYICEELGFAMAVFPYWTYAVFESRKDAIAYYRFAQIPRLLNINCGLQEEMQPKEAEYYLKKLDSNDCEILDLLLKKSDEALKGDSVSDEQLDTIKTLITQLFDTKKELTHDIIAWGSLIHVIKIMIERDKMDFDPDTSDCMFLFSWDEVPGDDESLLRSFLIDSLHVDWVETAKISKTNNGEALSISQGESWIEIRLNEDRDIAILKTSEGTVHYLTAYGEDDELYIFDFPGRLVNLVNSGAFDETNEEHRELAEKLLMSHLEA